jgi:hypothetical protein
MLECPKCEGCGEEWTGYNRLAPIGSFAECGDNYACLLCMGSGEVSQEDFDHYNDDSNLCQFTRERDCHCQYCTYEG